MSSRAIIDPRGMIPLERPLPAQMMSGQASKAWAANMRASPAETRDDLVEDQHHVVTAADGGHRLQIFVGGRGQAGRVRDRLEDHRGHGLGVFGQDAVFHRRGGEAVGLFPGGEAVAVVQRAGRS